MGALLQKILGVFGKRDQRATSTGGDIPLTPERITERLQRQGRPQPPKPLVPAETMSVALAIDDPVPTPPSIRHDATAQSDPVVDRSLDDPCCESDLHATSAAQGAVDSHIAIAPPIEAEVAPDAVSVPTVEQPPRSAASVPGPSAEILEEFQTFIRTHLEKKPEAVVVPTDVLKILRLENADIAVSVATPVCSEPPIDVVPVQEAPAVIIEESSDHEIADEHVAVADAETHSEEMDAPPAWLDRSVGEVMLKGDCSVRLSNCIAANEGFFSEWTVGMALANRSQFAAGLMHVRSLGKKTANEALDALEAFALDPRIKEVGASPADPSAGFDPAKLDEPIRDVLGRHHVPVRLANLLATGAVDDITVRDFLLDRDYVRVRFLRCKNAGARTMCDAFDLLDLHVENLGVPDEEREPATQSYDEPPPGITTSEWIRQELHLLIPKQVEVLRSRYGLEEGTPQTLQEIADRVHVTRERVRQVEAKALKRLRAERRSWAAFRQYLVEERDPQWTILFGPESTIPENEVSERFRRLDPWFLLAIDIVFEDGRDGYLSANAHRTATGWFKSSGEADERQKLDLVVNDILGAYQTPLPLDTLGEIAPSVVASLSTEGDNWSLRDGYILTGYVGPKARRTLHMHAIARRIALSGIFDIGTLIAEYRSQFPKDDCGSRMFELQAQEAPHLFAPLFDGIWLCLDRTSRPVDPLTGPPFCRREIEETHFAEGSMGDLLIKKLVKGGPQRMIDLRRDIVDDGQGSFSISSVGQVLISNPCFRRIAPGIFGLFIEGSETSATLDAHLLEDRHCRLYCHARHSGAPSDYYPAWGAAYEMRLSSWARHRAPPELYHSLMTVIEPGDWPASPETITEFLSLRDQDGVWQLGGLRRHALGHRFLDSKQFFSVLTHLVTFGWIGWYAVNRVTGTISSNHHAADVLAFLVMTGLVEPESDWQAPHYPTHLARRLFVEARWERHLHGVEASGEDVFGRLRSALYEAPPTASRGWVDVEEFTTAMPVWRSDGISTGRAFGGAQARQPGINAEESFESDDWDAVFGG